MNDLLQQLSLLKPQLIQAVTLLNKTSGKLAIPIFWEILGKWPSARHLSNAALPGLVSILQRIGTQTVRAKRLIALSAAYLSDPPSVYDPRPPRGFMGSPTHRNSNKRVGPYALDSYRIFCTVYEDPTSQEWKQVQPTDKQLSLYLKWKWAAEEHKQWCPVEGVVGEVTPPYILSLIEELEHKLSP
ncbi:hypothetical protein BJ165DRAFT_1399005 [Panaeolus papilionaceus]|nr:hypothetical protein BJ165DRAFT_1399005 [Panaeolus papilionaceus]